MKSTESLARRRKNNSERNAARSKGERGGDQGIRKDERGQAQPADKKRARENR